MAERFPSFDIVAEETRLQLDLQHRHFDALDTKAGIVLGFSGVLVALGTRSQTWLTATALVLAVASSLCSGNAFRPRNFPVVEVLELRERYLSAEPKFTSLRLLDSRVEMWHQGTWLLELKAKWLKRSLGTLALSVIMFAADILAG